MTGSRVVRGLTVLVAALLLLASVLGDFFSTNRPDVQDLDNYYAPPTRIHFVDPQGRFRTPTIPPRVRPPAYVPKNPL